MECIVFNYIFHHKTTNIKNKISITIVLITEIHIKAQNIKWTCHKWHGPSFTIYEEEPPKPRIIYKKSYIYSHMFKRQSPSKYSPFDAIHLLRLFWQQCQLVYWYRWVPRTLTKWGKPVLQGARPSQ